MHLNRTMLQHSQRGNGLLLVIMVFAVLFAVVGLSLEQNSAMAVNVHKHHQDTAALNLAEAGLAYALDKMHTAANFYGEENLHVTDRGTCTVSITQLTPSNKIEVVAIGRVSNSGSRASEAVKTIRMMLQRGEEGSEPRFILVSKELTS